MRKYGFKRPRKPKDNVAAASREEVREYLAEQAKRNAREQTEDRLVECSCGYTKVAGEECDLCGNVINTIHLEIFTHTPAESTEIEYEGTDACGTYLGKFEATIHDDAVEITLGTVGFRIVSDPRALVNNLLA